ncbi:MAG: ATP-dependent DNA helicase RecG [Bacteroidota bacterium]|nr:ATP-dependent DNA helicase RecG [Bacteroidota bacterium]
MQNDFLKNSIEYLKGMGSQRATVLQKELGIYTFADLLNLFPYKYIDKTAYYKINQLSPQHTVEVQIVGKFVGLKMVEQKRGKRLVAAFVDDTGQMEVVWFNGHKWIKEHLKPNEVYVIFGKVNLVNGTFSMPHPEMELLSEHKKNVQIALQPVYPSTELLSKRGITSKLIHKCIYQIFVELHQPFAETLPKTIVDKYQLIDKNQASFNIHFPQNSDLLAKAQFRLKFEELFFIQLRLVSQNFVRKHKTKGHLFDTVGTYFNTFYKQYLPFPLTQAQKRVIKEIRADLGTGAQMNRLLQGDVGSGKTITAFMIMLLAIDNGYQACIMAPTEILATQHYHGINSWMQQLGLNVALLTGSTKTSERKQIHQQLQDGSLHIIVGTHALLEDVVQFHNLGIAIIDEQHRFGVAQRSKLWKKNTIPPHILVMTATPIPRTLAMSLYGDLDVSVIDQLPAGRKPIKTLHKYDNFRSTLYQFIKDEIQKGRQIYVVYPLIQESENMDYKDLYEGYENLKRIYPEPQYKISMVHGQMKPAEKEEQMQEFLQGKTQIMVATTVIEVGVNVPNASVMVIESAERFGLSQLHQLRGRVGRGAEQSYCILMTSVKLSADSKVRMDTMVQTNDGFEIAEVDLKLRGPGDLMGTQQSGVLNLKIADIVKDRHILSLARASAFDVLKADPSLSTPENATTRIVYNRMMAQNNWNKIS